MKKYSVLTVSSVTGLSEATIRGYFYNRGISTEGGLDIRQILEVINSSRRKRGNGLDEDDVAELTEVLRTVGAIK